MLMYMYIKKADTRTYRALRLRQEGGEGRLLRLCQAQNAPSL